MSNSDLDKAVEKVRRTWGYRALVFAYRCLAVGLVGAALTAASVLLRSGPVTLTLAVPTGIAVWLGVGLNWVALWKLHSSGVMPRGGTNRHRALMRAFWRDVAPPLRKRG